MSHKNLYLVLMSFITDQVSIISVFYKFGVHMVIQIIPDVLT